MKWSINNLLRYNHIRPLKRHRYCSICKNNSKVFKIRELENNNIKYKSLDCLCPSCYEKYNDEEIVTIPSYIIDFNLLQYMETEREVGFISKKREDYYNRLKESINKDNYFRYLKRVNNRRKLYNKKNK